MSWVAFEYFPTFSSAETPPFPWYFHFSSLLSIPEPVFTYAKQYKWDKKMGIIQVFLVTLMVTVDSATFTPPFIFNDFLGAGRFDPPTLHHNRLIRTSISTRAGLP